MGGSGLECHTVGASHGFSAFGAACCCNVFCKKYCSFAEQRPASSRHEAGVSVPGCRRVPGAGRECACVRAPGRYASCTRLHRWNSGMKLKPHPHWTRREGRSKLGRAAPCCNNSSVHTAGNKQRVKQSHAHKWDNGTGPFSWHCVLLPVWMRPFNQASSCVYDSRNRGDAGPFKHKSKTLQFA